MCRVVSGCRYACDTQWSCFAHGNSLVIKGKRETGGTSTAEYFAIADKHLSDAIALDAQKHPEETIFTHRRIGYGTAVTQH